MSLNISLEEIEKIWPSSAPDIKNINKYVEKYKDETIVIKYGGNVLTIAQQWVINKNTTVKTN